MAENEVRPEEQPTLEDGEPEGRKEEGAQVSPEDQAKAILEELKALGVEKPEQIQNMATAASQAGVIANHLGEAREEIARLKAELESIKSQTKQPSDTSDIDLYNMGETVDLGKLIENKLENFYVTKVLKPQQEATARYFEDLR